MKKILLLGDSIRMGYDSFVKKELKEYEVYYDDADNGRFSSYTIWQFNLLNNKFGPFDVVHFNNGYWDMNHEGPKGEEAFPLEDYLHNLKRLIGLIRETKAIPIFALTTPICDKLQTISKRPSATRNLMDSLAAGYFWTSSNIISDSRS